MKRKCRILIFLMLVFPLGVQAGYLEDVIKIDQSQENNTQKIVQLFVLKKQIYIDQSNTRDVKNLEAIDYAQKVVKKKIFFYTNLSKNKNYMRIAHA
jgi:hypothetical protein